MFKSLKQKLMISSIIALALVVAFNVSHISKVKALTSNYYGVSYDSVTGNLTGYAWNSNIGWIKFGGMHNWPIGNGTTPSNAKIANNKLVGWARACAATVRNDCDSAAINDSWDGWISLDGTSVDNKPYGVSVSGNDLSGYAWGADVIGWTDFSKVKISQAMNNTLSVDINASPLTISPGETSLITWISTGAASCSFKKDEVSYDAGSNATSGSFSSGPLNITTTYFATCKNADNSVVVTDHATVTVGPKTKDKNLGDCVNPTDCKILWSDDTPKDCTFISEDISGDTYECVDPSDPENPDSIIRFTIPTQHRSTCSVSQNYVNRTTTWTLLNDGGAIGKVNWKGTNIMSKVTTGNSMSNIYTTIGQKNIIGVTTITPATGLPYISACNATTTMKLDPGAGGNI